MILFWTLGRTPWMGDQPDARPLPIQDSTTQKDADTHIHALSGIRTHDSTVRAVEDSTCLRPRGHWDWQHLAVHTVNISSIKKAEHQDKKCFPVVLYVCKTWSLALREVYYKYQKIKYLFTYSLTHSLTHSMVQDII
jgi:hypothetical protein